MDAQCLFGVVRTKLFELISLAVSATNGCEPCIGAHEPLFKKNEQQ